MNLEAPPGAPWPLQAGAAALLIAHIGGGATGIMAGAAAMTARKGGRAHRMAGNVFFAGMLAMTLVGATVAPFLHEGQWTNTLAATFTLYLTVTGWLAGRRRGPPTAIESWAWLLPAGVAAAAMFAVVTDAGRGDDTFFAVYGFAALSLVGIAGDVRLLRSGGLEGVARTSRHIWRISLALFVAAGSYFLGQPRFVPRILNETGLNAAPPLAVLALLVFWMIRVRWSRRRAAPLAA